MHILIIILILLGPAIIKSIKEKNKIQEKNSSQVRRKYTPNNVPIGRFNVEDNTEVKEGKRKDIVRTYEIDSGIDRAKIETEYEELKSRVEDIPAYKERIKKKVESNRTKKTSYTLNKLTKEDILRGIVLKEILSEPKSMQNRMR